MRRRRLGLGLALVLVLPACGSGEAEPAAQTTSAASVRPGAGNATPGSEATATEPEATAGLAASVRRRAERICAEGRDRLAQLPMPPSLPDTVRDFVPTLERIVAVNQEMLDELRELSGSVDDRALREVLEAAETAFGHLEAMVASGTAGDEDRFFEQLDRHVEAVERLRVVAERAGFEQCFLQPIP